MSTLLMKWAHNTQTKVNANKSAGNNSTNGSGTAPSSMNGSSSPVSTGKTTTSNGEQPQLQTLSGQQRKWIHPPEKLQQGHIAYLVKFLGNTVVDQPKGIEVVKEGIRKLRFNQQLRKSETGSAAAKPRKIELTISVDGVAIQEPRTHCILHQFPLHRISYCADDKSEKKFFSFIAKQPNQVDSDAEDTHECFVFISDKRSEEITLTIGQAFELAYKRFLETSGKDLETSKRAIIAQRCIQRLEHENVVLKKRLLDLCQFKHIKPELNEYLRRHDIRNIVEVKVKKSQSGDATNSSNGLPLATPTTNNNNNNNNLLDFSSTEEEQVSPPPLLMLNGVGGAPPVPPRNFDQPVVGRKLEGLLLNAVDDDGDDDTMNDNDDDFDPRAFAIANGQTLPNSVNPSQPPPFIAPPPKNMKRTQINPYQSSSQDLFGSEPFSPMRSSNAHSVRVVDPFEMDDFIGGGGSATTTGSSTHVLENAIGLLDKRIMEMKNGFSRGISFGNDDFSLESLDPLKH